jgi:hypothetical protein
MAAKGRFLLEPPPGTACFVAMMWSWALSLDCLARKDIHPHTKKDDSTQNPQLAVSSSTKKQQGDGKSVSANVVLLIDVPLWLFQTASCKHLSCGVAYNALHPYATTFGGLYCACRAQSQQLAHPSPCST